MKFKSKSDMFFQVVLYGVCLLLVSLSFFSFFEAKQDYGLIVLVLINVFVIGLILWLLHGTNYELNDFFFQYRAAFFRGKIPLENIQELVVGKTMWAGYKPATARNGIIIKYDSGREIYISPNSNESFVEKIQELNPEIKISY